MKTVRQDRAITAATRRSNGRRAFMLAVYLLTALGTPVGHGVFLGIHLLLEHSLPPVGNDRPGIQARFQAALEATRIEWARELGIDDFSGGEHRHGDGEPHVHGAATAHHHAHPDSEGRGGAIGSHVDSPDAGAPPARGAVPTSGEHSHDGFVHSHDDDDATRELALLSGSLSKQLLPHLPAPPFAVIGRAAEIWPAAAGHSPVYFPVPLPPPELV